MRLYAASLFVALAALFAGCTPVNQSGGKNTGCTPKCNPKCSPAKCNPCAGKGTDQTAGVTVYDVGFADT